jgi:hypothetical protein
MTPLRRFTDAEIVAARPPRRLLPLDRPSAFLVEPEYSAAGRVEDVATIFLTNRECPFKCLMCDLWKHTLAERVPRGAIPTQIDFALARLPPARHVKLYNAGNFFDPQAIPPDDHAAIVSRVNGFATVIVENHPLLCDGRVIAFRRSLDAQLELALGLETIHPEVLPRLNKRMTVDDFDRAVPFLTDAGIFVRAFVLLRPPFLSEEEGVEWALKTVEHAFSVGVGCCSVIPTRAGNGVMERLQAEGLFSPPRLESLLEVQREALRWRAGRVFVDLWDAEQFAACQSCRDEQLAALRTMNLTQEPVSTSPCTCPKGAAATPVPTSQELSRRNDLL